VNWERLKKIGGTPEEKGEQKKTKGKPRMKAYTINNNSQHSQDSGGLVVMVVVVWCNGDGDVVVCVCLGQRGIVGRQIDACIACISVYLRDYVTWAS
jgi:hypothetical protein